MKKFNKSWGIALLVGGLSTASLVHAHGDKHTDADVAIEYRQGAFHMIKYHFDVLGSMVKGKRDYDSDLFIEHAEVIRALSQLPGYGFPEGSHEGKEVKTDAKKEIWENHADFDEKLKTFQVEVVGLAEAAASGDMSVIKPRFGKTGQSCKACHDSYRDK